MNFFGWIWLIGTVVCWLPFSLRILKFVMDDFDQDEPDNFDYAMAGFFGLISAPGWFFIIPAFFLVRVGAAIVKNSWEKKGE